MFLNENSKQSVEYKHNFVELQRNKSGYKLDRDSLL